MSTGFYQIDFLGARQEAIDVLLFEDRQPRVEFAQIFNDTVLPKSGNDLRHHFGKGTANNRYKACGNLGDECRAITPVAIQLI